MMSEPQTRAQELWEKGYVWNDVVGTLRREGFSKIDCIRATTDVLRIPLAEAKRLVHFSPTWSDVRSRDDAFHSLASAALASATRDADHPENSERLSHAGLAQRFVGVVTALREGDLDGARTIVEELLDDEEPDRVVLLSGVLTAALAEMAQIGTENLIEALGILVATTVDPPPADAAAAIALAEEALAAR